MEFRRPKVYEELTQQYNTHTLVAFRNLASTSTNYSILLNNKKFIIKFQFLYDLIFFNFLFALFG
ncbi:unnamed protein product [Paramecium octaurelia]|uniref:Uncharacterized protein n=1 Tax=Paramecium octaurelia TaxID=43137 RepID=A0A8S1SU95_PAROT|nr:unnamed protein product [Paramecium octaurelia]